LEEEPSLQELDDNGIPILNEEKLAKMGKDVSRMKQRRQDRFLIYPDNNDTKR